MVYIMCLLFLLLLVVFVFFIYPVYFSEFASPEAISPKESLWQLMEQIFKRPDQMPFLLSNHGIKALNVVHIICILSAILASFMVLLAIQVKQGGYEILGICRSVFVSLSICLLQGCFSKLQILIEFGKRFALIQDKLIRFGRWSPKIRGSASLDDFCCHEKS